MQRISLYQVDAFTDRPFRGNPAAVCPLEQWLPEGMLQQIAAENNLSETAFFVPKGWQYELRWFTPKLEVDLCGHATLASAHVLFEEIEPNTTSVRFQTKSGPLEVARETRRYTMDFPSRPARPVTSTRELEDALGAVPIELWQARDLMAVFESAEQVRALAPDFAKLARLPAGSVCATAPGTGADRECDFVSRFFAPAKGIDEDPVTGSAHCTLTPYWARRFGRPHLRARQVSARGGELWCQDAGERVKVSGQAVTVMRGALEI